MVVGSNFMKPYDMAGFKLIILTLILCPPQIFGQYNITNNTLIDTSSNLLFIGINNEIAISSKYEMAFELHSKKGIEIKKVTKNKFIITPESPGIDSLLLIANKKTIYTKAFSVVNLPNLTLSLGSINEGLASKEEIIANKRLQIYFANCKCPIFGIVASFKIRFVSDNISADLKYISIEGNTLNEMTIQIIRKLSRKDQIVFEDINIRVVDSHPRSIPKFVLTIK